MSVIVKGIEMPKSCDICPFCGMDYTCMNYTADCFGFYIGDYEASRHHNCNLELYEEKWMPLPKPYMEEGEEK